MAAPQAVDLVAADRFYNYWFYIFLCYDRRNWDRKGFDVLVETVL